MDVLTADDVQVTLTVRDNLILGAQTRQDVDFDAENLLKPIARAALQTNAVIHSA
jgi:hypothetical protein